MSARDRTGTPVKPVGLTSWLLTVFIVALLSVTIVFLCLTRYTRRETVSGTLEPTAGALRVSSLSAGIISEVRIHDGQDVAAGQALLTLGLDPAIAEGRRLGEILSSTSAGQATALAQQSLAQRDLIARQREAISIRKAALLDQRKRLEGDTALQRQRVELAEQTAAAARTLWAQQLMSGLQYRQREEALIVARQGLSAIERDLAAIPSSLAELEAEDRRILAQSHENSAILATSRAQLDERNATTLAQTKIVLTAPKAGKIAALNARLGAPVSAGQTVAYVLPHGVNLQAELWVPSRAAGMVRAGDQVRVMFDAFPYQRFGVGRGRVVNIAGAPTAPADLPIALRTEEALYRVVVELENQSVQGYGKRWQLAPGMRLTADMVLEQQSLWNWLFDKVRAAQVRSSPL